MFESIVIVTVVTSPDGDRENECVSLFRILSFAETPRQPRRQYARPDCPSYQGYIVNSDFLGDRRKALEDSFFARENDRLRKALLEKEILKAQKEMLSDFSGISDDAVLEHLVTLGIGADTLAALSLVPLVEVAWADGRVDDKERDAILAAAEAAGLGRESASAQLLEGWLTIRPDPEIVVAWKEYVGALSATMSDERKEAFKQGLLSRSRSVAQASGGVLGFGTKVSKSERGVMDELEQAFS